MSPHFQPARGISFQTADQANRFTLHDSMNYSSVLCKDCHAYLWLMHGLYTLECLYSMWHAPLSLFLCIAPLMSLQTLGHNGILLSSRLNKTRIAASWSSELSFTCQGWLRSSWIWLPDCGLRLSRACNAQPCSCLKQRRVYMADQCWWPQCLQEKQAHDFSPYNCPFKYCFPYETEPWHLTLVF